MRDALDGRQRVDGADCGVGLGVLRGHGGLVGGAFSARGDLAGCFKFAVNKRQLAGRVNMAAGDDGRYVRGDGSGHLGEGQSQLGEALLYGGNRR
jgi:hypothetical protein